MRFHLCGKPTYSEHVGHTMVVIRADRPLKVGDRFKDPRGLLWTVEIVQGRQATLFTKGSGALFPTESLLLLKIGVE